MTQRPPIADLIARTPGAQTRDEALASIKARRERLLGTTATAPADPAAAEPLPDIDTEAFAKEFFRRQMEKDAPPPRGGKPRLAVDNDNEPERPKPE